MSDCIVGLIGAHKHSLASDLSHSVSLLQSLIHQHRLQATVSCQLTLGGKLAHLPLATSYFDTLASSSVRYFQIGAPSSVSWPVCLEGFLDFYLLRQSKPSGRSLRRWFFDIVTNTHAFQHCGSLQDRALWVLILVGALGF